MDSWLDLHRVAHRKEHCRTEGGSEQEVWALEHSGWENDFTAGLHALCPKRAGGVQAPGTRVGNCPT